MRVRDLVYRLLGRNVKSPELEHADEVIGNIKSVQIKVVPKNHRALAELRRLEGHAKK